MKMDKDCQHPNRFKIVCPLDCPCQTAYCMVCYNKQQVYTDSNNIIIGKGADPICLLDETNWKPEYGGRLWYDSDGKYHRDGDKPAVLAGNIYIWYQHGKITRDPSKGPSEIENLDAYKDKSEGGKTLRYSDSEGEHHRDGDLPAVISPTRKTWFKHGKIHRPDDKPAVVSDKTQEWRVEGIKHRDGDQPAYIRDDGLKIWCQKGSIHRDVNLGPAVIRPDGAEEYFIFGHSVEKDNANFDCNCPQDFPKITMDMGFCGAFLDPVKA